MNEKYALNWGNHADHLKHSFSQILEAHDFVDVTLSCEGKKIKAHRIILSAFSSYFYDILKDNPCAHPTIVLRDIKYSNVNYLLKFMYCGEVQVPTAHFNSFLQTAELLQISGLTESDNKTEADTNVISQDAVPVTEKPKLTSTIPKVGGATNKRISSTDSYSMHSKKKKDENPLESDENLSDPESKEHGEVNNEIKSMCVENIPNIQKLLDDDTYLSKDANPECECPVCAEKFTSISGLRQHMPFHMGETTCKICGKIMSRVDILRKHLIQVHKIQPTTTKKVDR